MLLNKYRCVIKQYHIYKIYKRIYKINLSNFTKIIIFQMNKILIDIFIFCIINLIRTIIM